MKTKEYQRQWRKDHPENTRANGRRSTQKLKLEVLSHYGRDSKAECVNCGYSDIRALCIDHILDNGNIERAKIGPGSKTIHRYLRINKFPPGYQTLCANCNLIKQMEKYER